MNRVVKRIFLILTYICFTICVSTDDSIAMGSGSHADGFAKEAEINIVAVSGAIDDLKKMMGRSGSFDLLAKQLLENFFERLDRTREFKSRLVADQIQEMAYSPLLKQMARSDKSLLRAYYVYYILAAALSWEFDEPTKVAASFLLAELEREDSIFR